MTTNNGNVTELENVESAIDETTESVESSMTQPTKFLSEEQFQRMGDEDSDLSELAQDLRQWIKDNSSTIRYSNGKQVNRRKYGLVQIIAENMLIEDYAYNPMLKDSVKTEYVGTVYRLSMRTLNAQWERVTSVNYGAFLVDDKTGAIIRVQAKKDDSGTTVSASGLSHRTGATYKLERAEQLYCQETGEYNSYQAAMLVKHKPGTNHLQSDKPSNSKNIAPYKAIFARVNNS